MLQHLSLALCVVVVVVAKPPYQNEIPNGDKVPHPCDTNLVWNAVGHGNADIGGAQNLNPFGMAFQAASHTWTQALCQMDSDNDGFTNGQELGDPQCTWRAGTVPVWPPTGHPGIDESTYPCSHAFIG
ncbi:temptin-like [Haliotis rubra]|uniref:temptin-like n=1 Tax=Haliotis rubra TaxID=36100 RepID=UPI001EE50D7D|nr:temptin-like [Haliotis rubra]